jgi:Rieske 2Fe-2S family protein
MSMNPTEASEAEPLYSSDDLTPALPASAYLDPEHFAREREAIFFREWTCVGRADQIPEAGDFLHVALAGERLLVVRDRQGAIGAFFNVCSHRGAELVAADPDPEPCGARSGRFAGGIRCPYHSWTYELDGRLRGAPYLEFGEQRPAAGFALRSIPVEQWGGFVFVNVAGAASTPRQSLAQQLGDVAARIARYPLADLRIGARLVYDVAANWKVLAENYNECYHCGPVHPELCQLVPAFKRAGGAQLDWPDGIPHRAGAWTFTLSGTAQRPPFPGLNDKERTHHKGELVYPNLWLSLAAEHVAAFTLYPIAPGATRIVNDFLFHKDEVVKPGFDPSDVRDFWHIVNAQDWGICESVQRGMSSRGFRSGYYAPMEDASLDIRRYVADRLAAS